jgi:hypothetical protein
MRDSRAAKRASTDEDISSKDWLFIACLVLETEALRVSVYWLLGGTIWLLEYAIQFYFEIEEGQNKFRGGQRGSRGVQSPLAQPLQFLFYIQFHNKIDWLSIYILSTPSQQQYIASLCIRKEGSQSKAKQAQSKPKASPEQVQSQ